MHSLVFSSAVLDSWELPGGRRRGRPPSITGEEIQGMSAGEIGCTCGVAAALACAEDTAGAEGDSKGKSRGEREGESGAAATEGAG